MSVRCEGSPWTAAGGTMIGVDSDHALTVWEGVFFTLERDTEAEAVDFRGTGNEPGWIIEVTEGRQIHFLYDYGESEIYTPAPERSTDAGGGAIEYHAVTESADLRVRFEAEPCADDMSGFPFPATVRVTLDARTFRGCGGPAPGAG
jgi:putative lipoprotein